MEAQQSEKHQKQLKRRPSWGICPTRQQDIFYTAIFYSKWNRMQGETDNVMEEKKRNTQKQTHSIHKPDRGRDKSVG